MMTGEIAIAFLLAAAVAYAATSVVRARLIQREILDQPTARSLHDRPVPRGGGLAIVLAVLGLSAAGAILNLIELPHGLVWWLCAAGYALLGWLDDVIDLPVLPRLVCQVVIASGFVAVALVPEGSLSVVGIAQVIELAVMAAAVIGLVWAVNLFNFMDGADGFAVTESLLVATLALGVSVGAGSVSTIAIPAALVGGASAGFLVWNWQPAKIFMGDAGSYFVGFLLGAMTIHGLNTIPRDMTWLILAAPFVVDATLTLFHRMLKRERWWQPHRSHIYQRLVLQGWTHRRLCIALGALTFVLLLPAAVIAACLPAVQIAVVAAVYLILAIMWAVTNQRLSSST